MVWHLVKHSDNFIFTSGLLDVHYISWQARQENFTTVWKYTIVKYNVPTNIWIIFFKTKHFITSKLKVKLYLCLIKHHALKTWGSGCNSCIL
jgi:hypothetical protein